VAFVFAYVALVVIAALVLYASWAARRLDRLHARLDAAGTALDAQLQRRAVTARAFGGVVNLDPSIAAELAATANEAASTSGLGRNREIAEHALTRALAVAVAGATERGAPASGTALTEMHDEALRATFARRFYNDAVRDVLVVRDRRVVRWLRLAGRAPRPAYFEMDDEELAVSQISVASGPTIEGWLTDRQ
jgi:hypothetical protein